MHGLPARIAACSFCYNLYPAVLFHISAEVVELADTPS